MMDGWKKINNKIEKKKKIREKLNKSISDV
jgi:hypothetical protein